MIGDASRTPCILDITKQVFGRETMRTLNSVECLAKGAALQAAMLNPTFSVSSFVVEEFNSLPVQICYQFDGEQDQKVKELFTVGSMFPLTKTVTFDNKLGGVNLLISYNTAKQAILKGLPDQISGYKIKTGKPKHADNKHGHKVKFTMRIVNDLNQIPRLGGADFTEEWTEEVQVPVKKSVAPKPAEPAKPEEKPAEGETPKEGEKPKEPAVEKPQETEQTFETQLKKKSRTEEINFDTQAHALPPNVRNDYRNLEIQLYTADRKFLDLKETKNNLEAYSYAIRDHLEGAYGAYCEDSIKAKFLVEVRKVIEWIYTPEGENASLEEYQKHLKSFKDLGVPIKNRYQYWEVIEDYYKMFADMATNANAQLAELAHLSDAQRETVIAKVGLANELIEKVKADLASKPRW